mgnify:FL=1
MMELSVIKETFKKNYIYILAFFLFLILNIILLELSPTGYSYDEVIKLIGIPNKVGEILIIYKIILFLFLIYDFYSYELRNIYDFILPRISLTKFYITKLFFLLIMVIVINLIHFLIIYLWFSGKFIISFELFLPCVEYFILLMFLELIFIDMFNSKFIILALSCLSGYLVYTNFQFKVWFIIICVIISYILFRLNIKGKYYKKDE